MFVLPVLTYTAPRAAADALRWRHATLDLARERGRQLGLEGAAFPWRWIDGVTGPDEYSAIADNNVYTKLMAQLNLHAAADAVERHPAVAATLGVGAEEAADWRDAARAVVIPYDVEREIHCQAEGSTEHDRWDFERTSPEQYPLLLHFPYYELYRKQVVKQADLVLAMLTRGDATVAGSVGCAITAACSASRHACLRR